MSAPHLPPVGPDTASDVMQSQETTVSTLTAFTSIVDLSVVGEEEDPELPPLTSICHCSMIKETSTNSQNGKISWLCKWCGKTFLPRHQSRAMHHVLKIKLGDIAICIARIPKFYKDQYPALYDKSKE